MKKKGEDSTPSSSTCSPAAALTNWTVWVCGTALMQRRRRRRRRRGATTNKVNSGSSSYRVVSDEGVPQLLLLLLSVSLPSSSFFQLENLISHPLHWERDRTGQQQWDRMEDTFITARRINSSQRQTAEEEDTRCSLLAPWWLPHTGVWWWAGDCNQAVH